MLLADVTDAVVNEIVRYGNLRSPNEACGIILPTLPATVVELPNTSPSPLDSYEVTAHAVNSSAMLQLWLTGDLYPHPSPSLDEDVQILVWHTHPSGFVGPSKADLRARDEIGPKLGLGYLVVNLPRSSAEFAMASRY